MLILFVCAILICFIGFIGGNQIGYSVKMKAEKKENEYSYMRFFLSIASILIIVFIYGKLNKILNQSMEDSMLVVAVEILLAAVAFVFGYRRAVKRDNIQL